MVLVEEGQILLQALNLHLQVRFGESQFVQDSAQTIDVSLHALAEVQLILIPARMRWKEERERDSE